MRFGIFDVDVQAGTLRRHGVKVRLPEQSFQVLAKLLERPGEVVSREELRRQLWPDNTFVDFDNSINAAVNRLREALGDSAANPRFIDTLPRRGYSFIAPVHEARSEPSEPPVTESASKPRTLRWPGLIALATLATVVAVVALLIVFRPGPPSPLKVARITPVTVEGRIEGWGRLVTDGSRLFFLERAGGHWNPMQVSVKGGESQPFPGPFRNTRILDISPDRSEFLIARFAMRHQEMPLWIIPVVGGLPRRVGNIVALDAAWCPDGRRIVYSRGKEIFIADRDGSNERTLVTTAGAASRFAWSPNARLLRFTVNDKASYSLWEVAADGSDLHSFPIGWRSDVNTCCGSWTANGTHFIFAANLREGTADLWAVPEDVGLFRRRSAPVQLTAGPISFTEPLPAREGARLFALDVKAQNESLRYDLATRHLVSFPGKLVAFGSSFTRDGQWIAYLDDRYQVWRRRVDGRERLQLTYPPLEAQEPRFSPNGRRIAFSAAKPGERSKVYVVPVEGGSLEPIEAGQGDRIWPDWSPDGNSLVFTFQEEVGRSDSPKTMLRVLDLVSRNETSIPGSEGLRFSRWSPDGRYLAATTADEDSRLMLGDRRTNQWSELTRGTLLRYPAWSRDPRYVYIQDLLAPGQPIYRVRVADRQRELVASFEEQLGSGFTRLAFSGLTWDGVPMLWATRGLSDIYALDLDVR